MAPKAIMPVTIRGVTYPTVPEAAAALNVTTSTIYAALSRNRIDTVGLGPGKGRPRGSRKGGKPKPTTIGGVTYPTRAEASQALGRHKGYVTDTVNRKKDRGKQLLIQRAMAQTAQAENASLKTILRGRN